MATDNVPTQAAEPTAAAQPSAPPQPARIWPGLLLVAVFWAFVFAIGLAELPISTAFMSRAGATALLTLLFPIWWLAHRSTRLADRLLGMAAAVVGGASAIMLSQKALGTVGVLFLGLPVVFTAWAAWLLVARKRSPRIQRAGMIATIVVAWMYFTLIRMDGISGGLKSDIRWRWGPRTEDAYLSERSREADGAGGLSSSVDRDQVAALELGLGDWPAFRGAQRDGQVRGIEFATNWDTAPPQLVWRQKIGPAWSSFAVVGDRLFTQEQVGDREAVVSLDTATGGRIWSHEDTTRWRDSQGGDGPRATPTFEDGRVYSQGATGILNCLDAATGKVAWSHNISDDSGAATPMWGFSSSPLVVEGMTIVYAGGKDGKGLLAYQADSGEPAWTSATGPISYSSPQLTWFDGEPQVLLLSDTGLIAVEPLSGKILWEYGAAVPGIWRAVQPMTAGAASIVVGSEDLGIVHLDVSRRGDAWSVVKDWQSKAMRPGYNDFVIQDGFAYGFDGGIFCCADLETGKRRWKGGRYGHGQVLLVADERLLLVVSETGEVVLLRATPEAHEEIARFQAIEGKTWNHPVIARECLFVRNDQEIACYRLRLK
jgi:outer membrane protein assembly factor BamB